jgi:hypothetical protein
MPALIAVCPKCNNDAPVPADAIGKKVKCKKCQNIFVIEALPTGKIEKPGKARPKTKSPTRPGTKADPKANGKTEAKATVSGSGGMRRPAKKSNAMLYIILGVLVVAAAGAGGAAYYLNSQPTETQHAKTSGKDRKDAKDSKGKDATSKAKGDQNRVAKNESPTARPPRDPKAPPDFKEVHAPVAPLLKGTPIEVTELGAVRDVFLMRGKTPRVGIRIRDKDKMYFETYDLEKALRIGRFEIPKDTVHLDVDPDGAVLALCDTDRFLTVYELPGGAVIRDDWRPYHDPKNEGRRIGDGDYTQFSVLSKDNLLILTTRNAGDIWDFRTPSPKFLITSFSHEEFQNSAVAKGHDSAVSSDRTMFAFATDEGIEFMDTNTGNKVGKTPKLSKFGPKVDVLGIGFDPGNKSIAAYIASGKTVSLARFQVPSGEPIGTPETVADPGEFANLAFVADNLFLSCEHGGKNRDGNRVGGLFDLNGRQLVECVFSPKRNGMFSANVIGNQVAYAYVNKDKPSVGIVDIPTPGTTPAAAPTPEMAADKDKTPVPPPPTTPASGSLADIFAKSPMPQPKAGPAAKDAPVAPPPAPTVRQERWEFGATGIAKKGETK